MPESVTCPLCGGTGHIHPEDALAWEGWPTTWSERHRREAARKREEAARGSTPDSGGPDAP